MVGPLTPSPPLEIARARADHLPEMPADPDPPGADYLDAIFASIRAFSQEMEASRRALLRAEHTGSPPWRLSFLREARVALERARARLATIEGRLAALGAPASLPPPLDRIRDNLDAMRADLASHGERLDHAEASVTPLGRA